MSSLPQPAQSALTDATPQLGAIRTGAQALGLGQYELLHAGPPLADPCQPPQTLVSSVVMTCLHEGWAATEPEAEGLLRKGWLTLSPAQDRGCVTPLAAVVSASTPLFAVHDANRTGGPNCWAPVGAVRGADTRMGWRDPGLLARLRYRDDVVAPALQALIDRHGAVPLWPLAVAGLAQGDDLHGSTAHANVAWAEALRQRGAPAALVDDVLATPLFFLTLWMAAAACLLRAAEGCAPTSLVTRAGGNGQQFGVSLAGQAGRWTGCDAGPPAGPLLPQADPALAIEGAIGDSAVIDMLGLGGQRLGQSPSLLALFADQAQMATDLQQAPPQRLLIAPHPLLPDAWPLGLDAARVVALQQPPRVMLAMLARDGRAGLCGRGQYRPPVDLFQRALNVDD
jgi:hypothetical protein